MLGGAIVRGIEATGVSAFAERCGAAVGVGCCGAGVDVGVVACGTEAVQAERTRNDVRTKLRMAESSAKRKPPRLRGGFHETA
jgi:hypothetical protein